MPCIYFAIKGFNGIMGIVKVTKDTGTVTYQSNTNAKSPSRKPSLYS